MKNSFKRILSLALCLALTFALMPALPASAEIVSSGYCGGEGDGKNLWWTFSRDGTMTIGGSGRMEDTVNYSGPWWSNHGAVVRTVVIQNGVTSVGKNAFYSYRFLESVTISDSVEIIDDKAFWGCISLKDLTIGNGVTKIGARAFDGCSKLTDVTIPDSLTTIDTDAFNLCTILTTVTLPKTVTSIGEDAFDCCNSLKYVFYAGSRSQWSKIQKGAGNERLLKAVIHYNSTGEHNWDAGSVTLPATCAAGGLKTFSCSVSGCYAVRPVEIPKDANNHVGGTGLKNVRGATCGEDGYTGDTYCKGCYATLEGGTAIPATGNHAWNAGEITTAATCAAKGVKTFTCAGCKQARTEEIEKDASNHVGGTEVRDAKDATCVAAGYSGDTYCKGCGAKLSSGTATDPTGQHVWDGGKVTKEAEVGQTGEKTFTCTVCGATRTETIPAAIPGDVDLDGKVDATDARLALRAAAKLDTLEGQAFKNADVNGDGKVDATDARRILRAAAKLEALS